MSTEYSLKDSNILKGDEVVGTYDAEENKVVLIKRPGPHGYKALSAFFEELGKEKPIFDIEPENEGDPKDTKPEAPKEPKAKKAEETPKGKEKPEAPEKDPFLGDKTPAYIRWFRDNHTEEEFQAKYGNRKYEPLD